MSVRKGLEFYLEYPTITEDENWKNPDFVTKVTNQLNDYDSVTTQDIGFYESTNTLVFHGYILEDTKKEVNAIYTLYKSYVTKMLREFGYKKHKPLDRMKLYFDKMY